MIYNLKKINLATHICLENLQGYFIAVDVLWCNVAQSVDSGSEYLQRRRCTLSVIGVMVRSRG